MKELINDPVYEMLKNEYDELLLDYILLEMDGEYQRESSHKRAVVEAIVRLGTRERVGNCYDRGAFTIEEDKMSCESVNVNDFFYEGNNGYWLCFFLFL